MLSVFSLSAALGVAFSAPSDALRQQSSAQPYFSSFPVSLCVLSAFGRSDLELAACKTLGTSKSHKTAALRLLCITTDARAIKLNLHIGAAPAATLSSRHPRAPQNYKNMAALAIDRMLDAGARPKAQGRASERNIWDR